MPISVSLPVEDPLFAEKLPYWSRDSRSTQKMVRICIGDNDSLRQLFGFLRFIIAEDENTLNALLLGEPQRSEESTIWRGHYSNPGNGGSFRQRNSAVTERYKSIRNVQTPVSISNEIQMLLELKGICESLLSAYPTSLDQDNYRLAQRLSPEDSECAELLVRAFSNERHALIQVKGEKEVLHFYINMVNRIVDFVQQFAAVVITPDQTSVYNRVTVTYREDSRQSIEVALTIFDRQLRESHTQSATVTAAAAAATIETLNNNFSLVNENNDAVISNYCHRVISKLLALEQERVLKAASNKNSSGGSGSSGGTIDLSKPTIV